MYDFVAAMVFSEGFNVRTTLRLFVWRRITKLQVTFYDWSVPGDSFEASGWSYLLQNIGLVFLSIY